MTNEPFGRQLKPIVITFTGGEATDRDHWRNQILRFLEGRPCHAQSFYTMEGETVRIYPDANND